MCEVARDQILLFAHNWRPIGLEILHLNIAFSDVLQVWNAVDTTTQTMKEKGELQFSQTEEWMQKVSDIGFTLHFGSCTIAEHGELEVSVS